MKQLYIGVENEFYAFNRKQNIVDGEYTVERLIKENKLKYRKSYGHWKGILKTSQRAYVDGFAVELLTPPIRINEGFAMRLADNLTIARDMLVPFSSRKSFTGYSMHWNLTAIRENPEPNQYWSGLAIPFLLLGVNPISCGVNMRFKNGPSRYEILGESLQSHEQIAATALLLGAYHLAWANGEKPPLQKVHYTDSRKIIKCDDSVWKRNETFSVIVQPGFPKIIRGLEAQKVLEITHQWLKPYIARLGTENDTRYLKEFVEGSRKLEMDYTEEFKKLKSEGHFGNGKFYPSSRREIRNSGRNIELPIENRLVALLTTIPRSHFYSWDDIHLSGEEISGTDEIYAEALKLAKERGLDYMLRENPKIEIDAEKRRITRRQLRKLVM